MCEFQISENFYLVMVTTLRSLLNEQARLRIVTILRRASSINRDQRVKIKSFEFLNSVIQKFHMGAG